MRAAHSIASSESSGARRNHSRKWTRPTNSLPSPRARRSRSACAKPASSPPPEPLKLRRGGFLEIDPLPYRMLQGRANFELGQNAQPIATRGLVELSGTWLHRYYLDDDETWLQ